MSILEGVSLINGPRQYLWYRNTKEDKNLKTNIKVYFKKWNFTKKIINLKISTLVFPSNAFHVGDNYSKKKLITNSDMIHSDPRNRLKTQQEIFCECHNCIIAGRIQSNLKNEGETFFLKTKFKMYIQNNDHLSGHIYKLLFIYNTGTEQIAG